MCVILQQTTDGDARVDVLCWRTLTAMPTDSVRGNLLFTYF